MPFFELPSEKVFNNNYSALSHREFVEEQIFDLYINNCIREVQFPFVSNPLSVSVQSSGKKRLILDLRYINKSLQKKKVKFEDLRTAQKYLSPMSWMFSFDMKAGYHHVPIAFEHQKMLGFSWDFGFGPRFFVFRVLPFGLSAAPWLFTKLMRPLVKYWRGLGFPLVLYLDDALGIAPSWELAVKTSEKIRNDLQKAGIMVNSEKSVWVPTQKITWLGFIIDSISLKIQIPHVKREKVFQLAQDLFQNEYSSARNLAKFAGLVMSFWLPLGNLVKLMTKNLYSLIESRLNWDSPIPITTAAKIEIKFWRDHIRQVPTKCLISYQLPEKIIFSDASSSGCGAILLSNNAKCFKPFSVSECAESSTARELTAVLFTIRSFASLIRHKTVLLLTDNQACAKIIESGSMKPHLQKLALEIFAFSIENNVNLDPRWIPREFNTQADALSKAFESDNWAVRPLFFRHFDKTWGPYTIDRFADSQNSQLSRFNSRVPSPGSIGIDAFSYDWSEDNNWLVPPVHLIVKTVKHLVATKAKGTLVCPKWTSASFWPVLFPFGRPASFITEIVEIPAGSNLFLPSSQPTSIFNKAQFPSPVLFLRLDAKLL